MTLLDQTFFTRNTPDVARDLLGVLLIREINGIRLSGTIIETEAYGGHDDPASHAYRGKTQRNQAMFGPVGHAYVYLSYGMHICLNIVATNL